MKSILYVTMHSPFDYSTGANQRSAFLLRALTTIGEVDIVSFTTDTLPKYIDLENCYVEFFGNITDRRRGIARWNFNLFSPNVIRARRKEFYDIVKEKIFLKDYDYIVVRYLTLVLECGLENESNLVVDVDDLPEDSYNFMLSGDLSLGKRIFYLIKRFLVKRYTDEVLKKSLHSFFPNKRNIKFQNSSLLPNIPYVETDTPQHEKKYVRGSIMFVGLMSYEPNINGVSVFLERVWGKVLDKYPEATFNIVGGGLDNYNKEKWSRIKGVTIKGYIADLQNEYAQTDLVVVPIYQGSGTNIKVLEAMAFGKATIISSFAHRGFETHIKNDENILIAKNFDEYADLIVKLFDDQEFKRHLELNASKTIKNFYSFDLFINKVQQALL